MILQRGDCDRANFHAVDRRHRDVAHRNLNEDVLVDLVFGTELAQRAAQFGMGARGQATAIRNDDRIRRSELVADFGYSGSLLGARFRFLGSLLVWLKS